MNINCILQHIDNSLHYNVIVAYLATLKATAQQVVDQRVIPVQVTGPQCSRQVHDVVVLVALGQFFAEAHHAIAHFRLNDIGGLNDK